MLPPMLPPNAVPVTTQLDPVKIRPDIVPVVPVQPQPSNGSTIDMRNRDPEQSLLMLREEQQRRQNKRRNNEPDDPDEHLAEPGTLLNADNTVPVVPLIDDEPAKGLWVDIQV